MDLAKLGDLVACPCKGGPHRIVTGAASALVDNKPAARAGDKSSCGASIVTGLDWYQIEDSPAAVHGSATSCGGQVVAASTVKIGSPRGGAMQPLSPAKGETHNRRVIFKDASGKPYASVAYRLELDSGEALEGMTDANGEADIADSRFVSSGVRILVKE
ncbi:hypothetical protein L861_19945 [Litchfieldella anticariensis FP35 = DSM 16096]|uniref:PAAR motif family protein n=1 Tax=Litchfieldella anticariensis (strain DSM 16096 / CECT 5854 / CIP 108499 / LMG 22089 / FP35) TaxID=1121939 RepID=S2KJ00_LITA3|nr:PAAR domain-containing protein [Halomonas anticariensis]EPC01925.1 hypothetical protein L861_19945 [Halomonas anticariensis FP35 = DSM 16096]